MFSNRFNTRNDPLLEAAEAAMKDGETRRQAEAFVNEAFGVYSRKAVVREELADYDAALEEVYAELKEGKSLDPVGREDKDIDNDGDHDKSDKYLLNRRKTIGRAMGKKMEETQIDEISNKLVKRYQKKSHDQEFDSVRDSVSDIVNKVPKKEREERQKERDAKSERRERGAELVQNRKERHGKNKHDREFNAIRKNVSNIAKKYAKEEYELDEAAYSAKAARAGKDIGKPGKQFSKIAKSAGKRYGSEERGKKVAGAILARIRAKHMKEDMRIGDPAADEPLKKAGSPPLMSVADPKGLKTSFSAINKAKEDQNKADLNATMDKAVGRTNMMKESVQIGDYKYRII